jgi:hypothetical protein
MLHLLTSFVSITLYLSFATCLLNQWLFFLLNDRDMSQKQRFLSKIILALITIFWPIIVPFAYLELLKFHRKYNEEIDLLRD